MSGRKNKYIVFGIEHYNSLGIIRSLGEEGITPDFIAIEGKANVASSSKYVGEIIKVRDYIEGCQLLLDRYGNNINKDKPIVIACDDEQVQYMDQHYEQYKDKFIFFNAGKNGRITEYMNKFRILELAKEKGLNTLPTRVVEKGYIPEDLCYPIITKSISPTVGGWKSDVFICEKSEELKNAYMKIQSPQVVLQAYIDKKNEMSLEGFSIDHGRQIFIAIAITHKYNIKGYYSPYSNINNFNNQEVYSALQKMMEHIEYEGIFEADFLINKDGKLYFSEINFRNTAWNYAATCAGMNLQTIWVDSMLKGKIDDNIYNDIGDGFTAMTEPIDYQKRVVEQGYSIEKWLEDFKNAKCKYYYNENDLVPFFVMLENNQKLR